MQINSPVIPIGYKNMKRVYLKLVENFNHINRFKMCRSQCFPLPEPHQQLGKSNQIQKVISIPNDFSNVPRNHTNRYTNARCCRRAHFQNAPQEKYTRHDLKKGEENVGFHNANGSMNNLMKGKKEF